jgi:Zn-finger nucleic acid-binding protein
MTLSSWRARDVWGDAGKLDKVLKAEVERSNVST